MSTRCRKGSGCYLFGPFGQPPFVVALPGQLWPKERVEVVNVQQGFLLDGPALALALDTFDETVTVATGEERR